jgi:hypothetical protein
MLSRRAVLLSLLAVPAAAAAIACNRRKAGPLTAEDPVDTGFSGCTA